MECENLPLMDAVRKLAGKAGVVIPEDVSGPRAKDSREARGKLLDIHREATAFFTSS